jgi:hypothetical protein
MALDAPAWASCTTGQRSEVRKENQNDLLGPERQSPRHNERWAKWKAKHKTNEMASELLFELPNLFWASVGS